MPDNKLLDPTTGFYNFDEYVDHAYLDLTSRDPSDIIPYQVPFLRDALRGLLPSELVTIGADSGCGKTTLASIMAYFAASLKKETYFFFLEGDRYDVINRQRYRFYMKYLREKGYMQDMYISYRDFIMNDFGEYSKKAMKVINKIDEWFKEKFKTLHIYAREHKLDIEKFEGHFHQLGGKADLIILDHLQYFKYHRQSEYDAISDIMNRVKSIQDEYRIPTILISHLRKKGRDRGFPTQDELHGSSNIAKESDTVIILSPLNFSEKGEEKEDYEEQVSSGIYSTGIRVAKARTHFPEKIVSRVWFDRSTESYKDEYELAVELRDKSIHPMDITKYPKWAREGHAKTTVNALDRMQEY